MPESQAIWIKIVDFLLLTSLFASLIFFGTVSSSLGFLGALGFLRVSYCQIGFISVPDIMHVSRGELSVWIPLPHLMQ